MKEAAVLDRPHLKRAAIVGNDSVTPLGSTDAISTFTARHWSEFKTRADALDWLVGDAEAPGA